MILNIGDIAPYFSALCDEGSAIDLHQLRGKNLVLYFYPKDDTPGCSIEAEDFSKNINEFKKLETVVLGVSKDSIKSHCNFIKKYNISFNLISDTNGELCDKYDVIKEKSMFGKKYFGIERTTFVIDKIGNIVKIYNKVKVKNHVKEVLNFLKDFEENE